MRMLSVVSTRAMPTVNNVGKSQGLPGGHALGSLGGGDGQGGHDHDGGVPEGEVEAGVDRAFAVLHQFTHDVVDGGDVVGVHAWRRPNTQAQAAILAAISTA
jgi:hypothetical protein